MTSLHKNFIFLSQIDKIPVVDSATGRIVGCAADYAVGLREMYPKVSGLVVREKASRRRIYVPWQNVKEITHQDVVVVEDFNNLRAQDFKVSETEILLKDILWDKQIVDISGSKIVRVNDLHLLKEHANLWVVHIDVGLTGLLRRLGCLDLVRFLVELISSYRMKDRLVSWKFVQPVSPSIGGDALSLTIHHSRLSELHPAELADILTGLGTEERVVLLRSLDTVTLAHAFQELPLKVRLQIVELTGDEQLANIINEMAMDEVVDLLSQLPQKKRNSLFRYLPEEKTSQIAELIKYSRRIAGSIMSTEFITTGPAAAAGAVLEQVKKESRKKEAIYHVYVVDEYKKLSGMVTLQQLLVAVPDKPVSQIMRKHAVKVDVDTHIKDVAELFHKYDYPLIPVVDEDGKLEGIITMKDAFEAVYPKIREEAEETQFSL